MIIISVVQQINSIYLNTLYRAISRPIGLTWDAVS